MCFTLRGRKNFTEDVDYSGINKLFCCSLINMILLYVNVSHINLLALINIPETTCLIVILHTRSLTGLVYFEITDFSPFFGSVL